MNYSYYFTQKYSLREPNKANLRGRLCKAQWYKVLVGGVILKSEDRLRK